MPIQGSVLYRSRRTKTEKLQRKEEFSSQTPAVLGIPPVSATTSREGRLGSKYIEVPQPGTNSPFAVQVQRLHCREKDKHFRACFSTAPSCRQSQSSCWVTFQPSPRGILPSQLLCGGEVKQVRQVVVQVLLNTALNIRCSRLDRGSKK